VTDEKPEILKGKGFKWSEDESDWVRNLEGNCYETIPEDVLFDIESIRSALEKLKEELGGECDTEIEETFPDIYGEK